MNLQKYKEIQKQYKIPLTPHIARLIKERKEKKTLVKNTKEKV